MINSITVVKRSKNFNRKQRNTHGKPWERSRKRNGIIKLQTNISLTRNARIYLSNVEIDERNDGSNGGLIMWLLTDGLGCWSRDVFGVEWDLWLISW